MNDSDRRLTSEGLYWILKPILGLPAQARRIEIVMEKDMAAVIKIEAIASTPLDEPNAHPVTQTYYLWPASQADDEMAQQEIEAPAAAQPGEES